MQRHSNFSNLLIAALASAFLSACRGNAPRQPTVDVSSYKQLAHSEVSELRLERVSTITLGMPGDGVNTITDFRVHGGLFYVLDRSTKSVRVMDRSGRILRTIGRPGHGPGEFSDPMALAFARGTMLVADPRAGNRLSVFDEQGRFVGLKEFDTPTVTVRLAVSGDRIATMGVLTVANPREQGRDALGVSTLDGKPVGRGCLIDPRYLESGKRDGLLAHYDFGAVSADGGLLYCIQAISPVVQVMDTAGRPVRQIRVAPPFYMAPKDRKFTQNQKDIFDFIGSFTTHAAFFPTRGGFISAYSHFDRDAGELAYDLMACRGDREYRCAIARNVRRPVYVAAPDTVYMEEEAQANKPAQVGIYHLAVVE